MKINDKQYQELISLLNHLAEEEFQTIGEGEADALVLGVSTTQSIHTKGLFSDRKCETVSLSSSPFIQTALCSTSTPDGILVKKGKTEEEMQSSEGVFLSRQEYLNHYGILPERKYHIHEKRMKNGMECTLSEDTDALPQYGFLSYDLQDYCIRSYERDGNMIHLILNPDDGTRHYQVQMVRTGELTEIPVFRNVELFLELDESQKLQSITSKEEYSCKIGLFRINVKMKMKTDFIRHD